MRKHIKKRPPEGGGGRTSLWKQSDLKNFTACAKQRLFGAGISDVAFLLKGMLAVHPEEEYTPEQEKKFWDLVVNKEETAKIMSEEEFQLFLERTKEVMAEQYGKDGSQTSKIMFLIGWVTASVKQAYTSRQLRRIFALADEA